MRDLIAVAGTGFGIAGTAYGIAAAWRADGRLRTIRRLHRGDVNPRRAAAPDAITALIADVAPGADPGRAWWYGRIILGTSVSIALLRSPATTVAVLVAVAAVIAFRNHRRRRTRTHRDPVAETEILAAHLASGAAAIDAVHAVADGGDPDWGIVVRSVDEGRPLQSGLDRWANRSADPNRRLIADTWAVAGSTGAGIAPALVRAAATLRERIELDREIESLTAQARLSARVLTVVPIGFSALLAVVDHRIAAFLLTTVAGQLSIATGLLLAWAGARWMRHLVEMAR